MSSDRFVPRVEGLEDRTVPAGNVQLMVADGILYVAGDNEANSIIVSATGSNTVTVQALGDTTVNGQSSVTVGGVRRGWHIDLFGGDDFVLVRGISGNRSLTINGGDGNDVIGIDNASIRRDTRVSGGDGNDLVVFNASVLPRPVFLDTGAGDDQVIAVLTAAPQLQATNPLGTDFIDNRNSLVFGGALPGFTPGTLPAPDIGAPTATLTATSATATAGPTIAYSVTFDEDVSGFGASGIDVTNGTVTNFVQVNARSYTFEVTPAGQGTVTAQVRAGAASDAAGNASNASAVAAVVFDTVAPVLTLNPLFATAQPMPTFTGTVDDPAATVVVNVNGQNVTAVVLGTAWSATPQEWIPAGTYTVTVTATDAAGNVDTETTQVIFDATGPEIELDEPPLAAGTVTGTASDGQSGIGSVTVSARDLVSQLYLSESGAFDSATEVELAAQTTDQFATWSVAVPVPGTYTVTARTRDRAGILAIDTALVTVT